MTQSKSSRTWKQNSLFAAAATPSLIIDCFAPTCNPGNNVEHRRLCSCKRTNSANHSSPLVFDGEHYGGSTLRVFEQNNLESQGTSYRRAIVGRGNNIKRVGYATVPKQVHISLVRLENAISLKQDNCTGAIHFKVGTSGARFALIDNKFSEVKVSCFF